MTDTKFKYQYWLLKQVDEDVLNIIYDSDIENKIEENKYLSQEEKDLQIKQFHEQTLQKVFEELTENKNNIEIYKKYFKDNYFSFVETMVNQLLSENIDKASFELSYIAWDYFNNILWGCCFSEGVFAEIIDEFHFYLEKNSIEEFYCSIIWTEWNDIKKKGEKILKKYNLI